MPIAAARKVSKPPLIAASAVVGLMRTRCRNQPGQWQ